MRKAETPPVQFAPIAMLRTVLDSPQTVTYYDPDEEFVGPFPSWKDVRTDFGAKGDGAGSRWNVSSRTGQVCDPVPAGDNVFTSRVKPIRIPGGVTSWRFQGDSSLPNFGTPVIHRNQQLETYVMLLDSFRTNGKGHGPPILLYLDGNLATDPLNWKSFEAYRHTPLNHQFILVAWGRSVEVSQP